MKKTHIILLIGLAVVIGVILSMVGDYSSYESFTKAADNEGIEYHVAGTFVKEKGMEYNPLENADVFTFWMEDRDGNQSKVICNSDKPKDFELADEIVVIGKMDQGTFYASDLLTKCPSKYTDEEIAIKDQNQEG